jgi:membrane-associated phospholipid phosphatase
MYLSFHWLSDGLAGLALGIAIDRTLHLPRWRL